MSCAESAVSFEQGPAADPDQDESGQDPAPPSEPRPRVPAEGHADHRGHIAVGDRKAVVFDIR